MMEVLDAIWKELMDLGCFAGLLYLTRFMSEHPKDWLMWIVIALSLVNATLAGISAFLLGAS